MIDPLEIRKDFPILEREVHGKPLTYLDNAASSQKPQVVIDAIADYYTRCHSNIHRGIHKLAEEATAAYEAARVKVAHFVNAPSEREIISTRGTTESINLVAQSYARPRLEAGDEVVITELEHHSNLVPWQVVCEQTGATLRVAPIDDRGVVRFDEYRKLVGPRTRIVALAEVSNVLGTILPVREMADVAHEHGAIVLVDGAQAVPHTPVDVQALGADFYAFSGHKMYGPTGIGALWGRMELLEEMEPYQTGGSMIRYVSFEKTLYAPPPEKFEAGTPNIAGAIALGAAIDYLIGLGLDDVKAHEDGLVAYAHEVIGGMPEVELIGTAPEKASVVSFVVANVHAHDIGTFLDQEGVAVRVGHHCAQPVMTHFDIPAAVRASFGIYNTRDEVDRLAAGLRLVVEFFG